MDPNATLDALLALTTAVAAKQEDGKASTSEVDMAERIEALDRWLRQGGFLPERWARSYMKLPTSQKEYAAEMSRLFAPLLRKDKP